MTTKPAFIAMDLDDTMYGYESCHRVAQSAAEQAISDKYSLDGATVRELMSQARLDTKSRLGSLASSHSRLLYFKLTLEKLGLANHLDFALQLEASYWGNFLRAMSRATGLTEMLELCRQEAIPIFVMTDLTTQIQIKKLSRLDVLDYISGLVSSEEVGSDKPQGDFFEYGRQNLGLPEGIGWVVGDDLAKDGGLANASGSSFFSVERQSDGTPSLTGTYRKLVAACNP